MKNDIKGVRRLTLNTCDIHKPAAEESMVPLVKTTIKPVAVIVNQLRVSMRNAIHLEDS